MTEQAEYYVEQFPGKPITAEDQNTMQRLIKEDIKSQIEKGIQEIEKVAKAGDADMLGGKTLEQLYKELVDRVLHILPTRTGYKAIFKNLRLNEESVVEHKLGAAPLVDVYQLDYFPVVASEDGHIYETYTTFYLYHGSESRIRFRPEEPPNSPTRNFDIDPVDGYPYRIPFKTMLDLYEVEWHDDSSVSDLEHEFWEKFLSDPNDRFDDNQHHHSPWWDRCCREERAVRSLRRDWDDLYLQMRPRKTINYPMPQRAGDEIPDPTPAPTQVQVVHFNLDTLGLRLLSEAVQPTSLTTVDQPGSLEPITTDHLKVMVLLKV